jgi:dephospho-CoA kinase
MNPSWCVRTGRLILRPVWGGDLADLQALKADPRVFAVMLGGVRLPQQTAEELAADIVFWGRYGVGMWSVRDCRSGAFRGLTGILDRPDGLGMALRFAFAPEWHGRGYASEAAAAALRFGHDRAGLARIVADFGPAVLDERGELDRPRMGARVFGDAAARARLEAIVHPAVRALLGAELDALRAAGHALAIYDVPLLFEKQLQREVDLSVVVWAPRAVQLARLRARDGLSEAEAERRLAAQLPIDAKAAQADVVVVNDGDRAALEAKAARLLADLRGGLARRLPNAPPARY